MGLPSIFSRGSGAMGCSGIRVWDVTIVFWECLLGKVGLAARVWGLSK